MTYQSSDTISAGIASDPVQEIFAYAFTSTNDGVLSVPYTQAEIDQYRKSNPSLSFLGSQNGWGVATLMNGCKLNGSDLKVCGVRRLISSLSQGQPSLSKQKGHNIEEILEFS